jgi:two-component system, NarL family, response regulator LiaR
VAGKLEYKRPQGAVTADSRVRTLIVDDSEAVRGGLGMLLEAQPFCELVGAVSDPASALERTRAMHPHVVLQDFSMPGIDPFALVRELSACRPQPAVLILSAFADEQAARQAVQAGAIGWVLKDAEPEQLFEALLGAAGLRPSALAGTAEPGRHAPTAPLAPVPQREPEPELAASLDARTVWAMLRALAGDPAGLTIEGLATRAVLPVTIAARYVARMTARQPALVVPIAGDSGPDAFLLTSAGERELQRLERRIPAAQAALGTPQLLR